MAKRVGRSNDAALMVLTSLAGGPKHGHALLKDIESFSGTKLGPGTLYGAISRLEERGMIEALEPDGRTRPYRLTPAGREELSATLSELRTVLEEGSLRLGRRPALNPAGAAT